MNKNNTILNPSIPPTQSSGSTGGVISTVREQAFQYIPEKTSTDPVDVALLAITHHDFLSEIENSPVLGELVIKYSRNWQGILLIRTEINKVLLYIQESLLPDRLGRAGFNPGYIKILLFIQEKYRIFQENYRIHKENSPN